MISKGNGVPVIRPVTPADAPALCDIYNYYVQNTVVTFEEHPVPSAEMERRIRVIGATYPWLIFQDETKILGYAYANRWKERSGYRFSAESTVYCRNDSTSKGIGTALYSRLMAELRARGVHTVFGGIALPNDASCALHEKLGFSKVAHLREVGFKFQRWVDVGYWQLLL
jgi:L-amino acid N-acyltransferase YncA